VIVDGAIRVSPDATIKLVSAPPKAAAAAAADASNTQSQASKSP
jgi:hypothetical protein